MALWTMDGTMGDIDSQGYLVGNLLEDNVVIVELKHLSPVLPQSFSRRKPDGSVS